MPDPGELRALVETNRPEIVERLERYPLDADQVDAVLDRALLTLALQWKRMSDRRRWLLREIDRLCLLAIERRREEDAQGGEGGA